MFLRTLAAPIACLVLAGLVGIAATVDHWNKQRRMDHAELMHWYCVHRGTQCNGPSWRSIEAHWNDRQLAYEIVVIALAGAGALGLGYRLARR